MSIQTEIAFVMEALIIQASEFKREPGAASLADVTAAINGAGQSKEAP